MGITHIEQGTKTVVLCEEEREADEINSKGRKRTGWNM